MEYTLEDVSAVSKKLSVTVTAEEVNAAIAAAVALYAPSAQIDGFRKGKVPAKLIEQRFRDKLYTEAREDLINVHISQIFDEKKLTPLDGLNFTADDASFKRDSAYQYEVTFEVLPDFQLPPYEGVEVELKKAAPVTDEEVEEVLKRIGRDDALFAPVEGDRPPVVGEIANIDFELFDESSPEGHIKSNNYDLELGAGKALPDFEEAVKTMRPGESKDVEIAFPSNFLNRNLAGKSVRTHIVLNAIKRLDMPEFNDDFANKHGFQGGIAGMREQLRTAREQVSANVRKSEAQAKMVEQLLKVVDFELPPSLKKYYFNTYLGRYIATEESQGRAPELLGKSMEEIEKKFNPEVEMAVRSLILLMKIAEKENLQVTETEVQKAIFNEAMRARQDYNELRERYIRSGTIFILRDRLLADKAADLIFARGTVKDIPETAEATAADGAES